MIVYRLVTAKTIDEKIVERAAAKRKLEKLVIHSKKYVDFVCKLNSGFILQCRGLLSTGAMGTLAPAILKQSTTFSTRN